MLRCVFIALFLAAGCASTGGAAGGSDLDRRLFAVNEENQRLQAELAGARGGLEQRVQAAALKEQAAGLSGASCTALGAARSGVAYARLGLAGGTFRVVPSFGPARKVGALKVQGGNCKLVRQ